MTGVRAIAPLTCTVELHHTNDRHGAFRCVVVVVTACHCGVMVAIVTVRR